MDNPALEAIGAGFSYGARRVLHKIDLQIPAGQFVSIIGPNGSGKTTLFRLLCGASRCETGKVLYGGRDVFRMKAAERARQFSVVRQGEENGFPFTCLEMVLLGLHPYRARFGAPTPEQLLRVRRVMEETDTLSLSCQLVTQVSGGEFQRVALARALAQAPKVLFLDEAMSDLDISAKIKMTKYLRELVARDGLTVLAINHDLASAYRYSDRVVALRGGEVAAYGAPEQVMDEDFFARVFGVRAQTVPGKGILLQDCI